MQSKSGRAAWQEVMAHLTAGAIEAAALSVGQQMPPFLLPNADGRLVSSDEMLADGPLVVSFFRGDWCPWCSITLEYLQAALPDIAATGARLVALVADTGGRLQQTRQRYSLEFDLLCDVDHAVALQFGIVFRLPDLYRAGLAANGIDLTIRQGHAGWFVPVPATYVVDRSGIVRARFLDIDFTRRPEPAAIIEAVQALGPARPQ
jgi:peroxiredoxin